MNKCNKCLAHNIGEDHICDPLIKGLKDFHDSHIPQPTKEFNYNDHSHTHCWDNPKLPCGIPLDKHTQCCLCEKPKPSEENDCAVCKEKIEDGTTYWNLKVHPNCGYPIKYPSTPQPPQENDWEKEFFNKFVNLYDDIPAMSEFGTEVIGFIYNLLLSHRTSLQHDHEILVNTILDTKNQEIAKVRQTLLEEIRGKVENEIIEWEKGDYHTNIAGGAISALRTFLSKLNDLLKELK